MICPNCEEEGLEIEMEVHESVQDFHDPSQSDGHGQNVSEFWVCPNCDHYEEYIDEPDYED